MPDYYQSKSLACKEIEKLYPNNTRSYVEMAILRKYGFGSKFVNNYIDQIEKNGLIIEKRSTEKYHLKEGVVDDEVDKVFEGVPLSPNKDATSSGSPDDEEI